MIDFLNSLDQTSVLFGGMFVVITHILAIFGDFMIEKAIAIHNKRKSFKERDKP